jgi:hypothetical protein
VPDPLRRECQRDLRRRVTEGILPDGRSVRDHRRPTPHYRHAEARTWRAVAEVHVETGR